MKVLHFNATDRGGGGPPQVARDLVNGARRAGMQSDLLVALKCGSESSAIQLRYRSIFSKVKGALLSRLGSLAGLEGIGPTHIGTIENIIRKKGWDIFHIHNMHGTFDWRRLSKLAELTRIVITCHDQWLHTGHCAYTLGCHRWKTGCERCPDLTLYPALKRDGAENNLAAKKRALARSRATLVCPSQWLRNLMLEAHPQLDVRLIYNGIDTNTFVPGDRHMARQQLELPQNSFIALFVANNGLENGWKGGELVREVFQRLSRESTENIVCVAVGNRRAGNANSDHGGGIIERSHVDDPLVLRRYYQAADIFLYPTKADNCPLVVLEALSCGLPVIASTAGGCPEVVKDGETGMVISTSDIGDWVGGFEYCLRLKQSGHLMQWQANARASAIERFSVDRMIISYLDLYQELANRYERV